MDAEAPHHDEDRNVEHTQPEESASPEPRWNWEKILKTASKRRAIWHKMYLILTALHYGFSLLAISATVLVGVLPSSYPFDKHASFYGVMSILATLFVFLVAFASPSKQAKAYIGAWRHLDQAIVTGDLTQDETAIQSVLSAIQRGEELLSGKDPF
jgi:type IV secretory pathway component VirB8